MDTLERLSEQEKELGYDGEELKAFVKEQHAILREGRQAILEAERENWEAEERYQREKREAEEKTGFVR